MSLSEWACSFDALLYIIAVVDPAHFLWLFFIQLLFPVLCIRPPHIYIASPLISALDVVLLSYQLFLLVGTTALSSCEPTIRLPGSTLIHSAVFPWPKL